MSMRIPSSKKLPSASRRRKSAPTVFRLPFQINRASRLPKTIKRILRSMCNGTRSAYSRCPALPWNYRFLRMAMKQDPLIELVSFVFLRTPTDTVDVPENQLSLIPFPIDDIFLEELKNFDVVVFDDF